MRQVSKSAVAAAAVGFIVSITAMALPAQAVGGTCSSFLQNQAVTLSPDVYRAGASCSSLQPNSKARAQLIRTGVDQYSQWFTRLNTTYYTTWQSWGTGSAVQVSSL